MWVTWYWLAGFVDGEGCFLIKIGPKKDMRLKHQLTPIFTLATVDNLIPETGKTYLAMISDFLRHQGIHHTFRENYYYPSWGENASPQSQISINGIHNGRLFLSRILPYLIVKKEEAKIWGKSIKLISKRTHLNKNGFLKIMELVDEMRSLRSPRKKPKYTKQYFLALWGIK